MTTRVLLADDHDLFRQGVRALLDAEPGIEVVCEARDGRDAVELARRCRPDVAVLDVAMPELNGVEAARQMVAHSPATRIVALSIRGDRQTVSGMLRSGAHAYVHKSCDVGELLKAIRAAVAGRRYLSPEIASAVVEDYAHGRRGMAAGSRLSPREREVLQLLAEGKSAKQVGQILHVSSKTVHTHRQNIMAKLAIDSMPELTKYAIREGITAL